MCSMFLVRRDPIYQSFKIRKSLFSPTYCSPPINIVRLYAISMPYKT